MMNTLPQQSQECGIFSIPTLDSIKCYAEHALACCPTKLKKKLTNIAINVENLVSSEILKDLKIKKKEDLLGIYKDLKNHCELTLYRHALVLYATSSGINIEDVVTRVTIYEISHRTNCTALRKQWLDKVGEKKKISQ